MILIKIRPPRPCLVDDTPFSQGLLAQGSLL